MSSSEFRVLDTGYVRFIEAWGHGQAGESLGIPDLECGIVEAARQSTQGSFRGWEEDQKLLRTLYLSDPQHSTPFEFAGCTIEVQAPIMVFREWQRHRTQSYSEMSARYSPLPDSNYLPSWEDVKRRGEEGEKTRNRQAAGASPWNEYLARQWWSDLKEEYHRNEAFYQQGLRAGVPKELARLIIPMGRYSRMRASANLRNWLAFMTLRADPSAQWEIRCYAVAVGEILRSQFPRTWSMYVQKQSPEHRLTKFTDQQIREEMRRRGISIENRGSHEPT